MKRGGPSHPKTSKFARRLDLTRYEAVGILECLFHWAGAYARRGDVGRHEPGDIAEGIGWEGDPQQLLDALVESGWLDKCECHGLRIHGWPDHADQAVRKTREVTSLGFLECYTSGVIPEYRRKSSSGGKPPADSRHKTHDSRHKTPGTGAVQPRKPAWTSLAGDIYAKYLGTPSYDRIGKALSPLVAEHTWPVVEPLWDAKCQEAAKWPKPAMFTPEVFARTFVAELAKRAPQSSPPPPTIPRPLRDRSDRPMTPEELERIRADRAAQAEAVK